MTEEDIQYRQGRSKEHVEKNEKVSFFATMGLFIMLLGMVIYGLLT